MLVAQAFAQAVAQVFAQAAARKRSPKSRANQGYPRYRTHAQRNDPVGKHRMQTLHIFGANRGFSRGKQLLHAVRADAEHRVAAVRKHVPPCLEVERSKEQTEFADAGADHSAHKNCDQHSRAKQQRKTCARRLVPAQRVRENHSSNRRCADRALAEVDRQQRRARSATDRKQQRASRLQCAPRKDRQRTQRDCAGPHQCREWVGQAEPARRLGLQKAPFVGERGARVGGPTSIGEKRIAGFTIHRHRRRMLDEYLHESAAGERDHQTGEHRNRDHPHASLAHQVAERNEGQHRGQPGSRAKHVAGFAIEPVPHNHRRWQQRQQHQPRSDSTAGTHFAKERECACEKQREVKRVRERLPDCE